MAQRAWARAFHLDTLGVYMQPTLAPPADIRSHMATVNSLRAAQVGTPGLGAAVLAVKSLQSRRFAHSYADLLASAQFAAPTRFFLDELYGTRDFSQRDAQFSRIASTLERLFPASVVHTATQLAALHALSETLDDAMGRSWLALESLAPAIRYTTAWQTTGQPALRRQQLALALGIGHSLDKLTGTPGLRTTLKMMRGPAAAAGLADLQRFLETGFDTFASMRRSKGACVHFLSCIESRESQWINRLFEFSLLAHPSSSPQIEELSALLSFA